MEIKFNFEIIENQIIENLDTSSTSYACRDTNDPY